jgi:hypothetical protein
MLRFLMGKENVRLDALNSGRAPVLDAHADFSLASQVGVIENGKIEKGEGRATLRYFEGDPAADAIWNKVQQGARNISMGAAIHSMKEVEASDPEDGDKVRRFEAVDWSPVEISNVPIGADSGAQVNMSLFSRNNDVETIEVELLRPEGREEEATMKQTDNAAAEPGREKLKAAGIEQVDKARDEGRAEGARLERDRLSGIRSMVAPFKLSNEFVEKLTGDPSMTLEKARGAVLDHLVAEQEKAPTRSTNPHSVEILRDERETRINLAADVAYRTIEPKHEVADDNPFRGMRLSRMAEEILNISGVNTRGKAISEIALLSMQNSADFPHILENVARKAMLAAYAVAEPTYRVWTKRSTTPDFKTMSRLRLSETPTFLMVPEGGQITIGSMSESREQYAIATYGRGVSFTRQMLINDDLGAFTDLISAFGRQAARLENKTVYAILTANANMADGNPLFDAAHSNSGTGAIANTALDAMMTAMGTQKGLDGVTALNLTPAYLIVPKAKQATARTAMIETGPNVKTSDRNWFAGQFEVVADAELDADSAVKWYGAADPNIAPGIEYAHLEGAEGPQIIRKENEGGVLGVQLYGYVDFGAKAVDWRPLYYSTGS